MIRHDCQSNHRSVRTFVRCCLGLRGWEGYQGGRSNVPWVLITWCRSPAYSLWETRDEAEQWKAEIPDRYGCGGYCRGPRSHKIYYVDVARMTVQDCRPTWPPWSSSYARIAPLLNREQLDRVERNRTAHLGHVVAVVSAELEASAPRSLTSAA